MKFAAVERIADALLYEGYLLYPYRVSSVKNQQRWTFGCLFPPSYPQTESSAEGSSMQTECLLLADSQTTLTVKVRFLHLLVSSVPKGLSQENDSPTQTWKEAVERQVLTPPLPVPGLVGRSHRCTFVFPFSKQQQGIEGVLDVSAELVGTKLFRVRVRLENLTPLENGACLTREEALAWSFISSHTLLGVRLGKFFSMLDTPEMMRDPATACQNLRTWPVLVGEKDQCDTMLSAPIILYDYPQVAPESPGDLFDGTEIDEMLTLRIRTLTAEEKQEMADLDPRVSEILRRSEALPEEQFLGLHGAWRNDEETTARSSLDHSQVGIVGLKPGMRVRLRPQGHADVFDLALSGKTAVIVSIEQDYEDRLYVSVAVDQDPGQDLGLAGKPGHRFFFRPDEVIPLEMGGEA